MKTHYQDTYGGPACGADSTYVTQAHASVNCLSCQKTNAYKVASGQIPKSPALDFEVTDEVKAALKVIGKITTTIAEASSYCSQFDDLLRRVNAQLPDGAYIPGRYQHWDVKLSNEGGEVIFQIEARNRTEAEQTLRNRFAGALKVRTEIVGESDY